MSCAYRCFGVFRAWSLGWLAAVVVSLGGLVDAGATVSEPGFTETLFADTDYETTQIAWAPDGSNRLFALKKSGAIRIIKNGSLLSTPFATVSPVYTSSECGVLGITFDPNFTSNHFVYIFVTVSSSEQRIIRYTDTNDVGMSRMDIITGLPTLGQNHDGGALAVGPDGKLYWAIGDNGNHIGANGDLSSLASKVGRAGLDGSVPVDNPFVDGAGGHNDYIWALGFRNPFTMTFQPTTGKLWLNVTGGNYEQVFVVDRGDDGGWFTYENDEPSTDPYIRPVISYRTNAAESKSITSASRSGNVASFTTGTAHGFHPGAKITIGGVSDASFNGDVYVASTPSTTTFTASQTGANATSSGGNATTQNLGGALTGGCFYEGSAFPSQYQGNFFFGDYNSGNIMRARVSGTTVTTVDTFARVPQYVDCESGPDGGLYYVSVSGKIYRLMPTGGGGTPQSLIVSRTALGIGEGSTGTFTVRLGVQPTGSVTVNSALTSGSSSISVSGGGALTFGAADWDMPKTVTVLAAEDANSVDESAVVTVSSSGLTSQTVSITSTDNDTPSIILSSSSLTIDEGTSGTVTVKLSVMPQAAVTVNVSRRSGSSSISPSPAMLTFDGSTWNTPQTVTIAAAHDTNTTNDTAIIAFSATGLATPTVSVTSTDLDPSAPSITSSPVLTGVVGAPYRYDVQASGNPAPTFSLDTTVPGMTIDASTGVISWTPTGTGMSSVTVRAHNTNSPDATQSFTITVSPDTPPICVLTAPTEGQTVFGQHGEFFGDGRDDVGTTKAEFYVDDQLEYTDNQALGVDHFHYGSAHLLWDTTIYADGPHRVKMMVYDTAGQSCAVERNVTVDNAGAIADGGVPVPDGNGSGVDGQVGQGGQTGQNAVSPNLNSGCSIGSWTGAAPAGLVAGLLLAAAALLGKSRRKHRD